MRLVQFITAALVAFIPTITGLCFYPDRSESSNDVPCDTNADESMCCSEASACLTNGLCATDPSNKNDTSFYRGSCTDIRWGSSCLKQCFPAIQNYFSINTNDPPGQIVPVWECDGKSGYTENANYCCAPSGQGSKCCDGAVFELAAATVESPTVNIAVAVSTIVRSTQSPTSTKSSSPSENSKATGAGSARRLKIGLGVGIPLGVLLSVAFSFLSYRVWRNRNTICVSEVRKPSLDLEDMCLEVKPELDSKNLIASPVYEIAGESIGSEAVELDATTRHGDHH